MNAERLLAHYEQIADAPDAIARLRRFILDLAVRGKLVPQDPNDEPASELLKRIAKEKARLVKAGEARKSEIDPVSEDDAPFWVATSWKWTRLGSIADWGSGSTPPRGNLDFYGGGIAWLKSGELNDNRSLAGSEETVSQLAIEKGSFRINKPGDVLLAMYGATIGKVAILAGSAVTNQAVCGCTPFAGVFNQFLFLFLLSQREQFHSASEGGAQPNISKVKIIWTPFPLPPLAEQHRIVAKVDELMGLCDRLEAARAGREETRDRLAAASLARLNAPDPETFQDDARFALDALPTLTTRPDQIKRLRQTILNLAVRGKLVPQDANDETASDLLKRLEKAQIAAYASEGLRARPPVAKLTRADMWFECPESWALSSFDELFVMVSGVTKGQKVSANEAIDAPYLRVANVQRGHLDLSVIKKITVRKADIERYALRLGDVLMTEGGDWDKLGRAAIWHEEIPGCIHQNHIFRVRPPSKDVSPEWVITYVNSSLGRAFFEDASKQTTNLASINMTQLRGCPFPLPPLPEQHRIVAKVDALMALCDRLEASLTATAATRRRLLDALLAEALGPVSDIIGEAA